MNNSFNLERFKIKHEEMFATALAEVICERKTSHWMWYIFPQLKFLGRSQKSLYYGMEDEKEAEAFYNDPYLGANLKKICEALLRCKTNNAVEIFGYIDAVKLRSCVTLFYIATEDELFEGIIYKFFSGNFDPETIHYLHRD